MKCQIPNRIIIIGGNHQNTMAAIRCFGICRCNIQVLLHADRSVNELTCAKTKFSKGKTTVVGKTKENIVKWLLDNKTTEKQILFPCSDLAAYAIDESAKELSENYIIPGFKNQPGKVCQMMSKWEQKLFAEKNNIPMAKSWLVEINKDGQFTIPEDMIYPCIVKPNTSAFGVKGDICTSNNKDELNSNLEILQGKGYRELIIQEFLQNTEEYVTFGCLTENYDNKVNDLLKKKYTLEGNTTHASFSNDVPVKTLNDQIVKQLYSDGYRGMFDIEYLVCGEKVYLLEINFRQSGVGFGQVDNKVYTPYLMCLSLLGKDFEKGTKTSVPVGKTLIDETVCLRHRKQYGLTVFKWLTLTMTASAHAKFNMHDLKGTIAVYSSLLRKKAK